MLAFPLAGTIVISLGWRSLPGRLAGWFAEHLAVTVMTRLRPLRIMDSLCPLRRKLTRV